MMVEHVLLNAYVCVCACVHLNRFSAILPCGDSILGTQAAIYGDSNLRSQFRKIPRHPETMQ